ncbi:MAG TPA: ABC transporter ATP-binding protein [Pyrinomonadaceae bacterium]
MADVILQTQGLTKRFGRRIAVDNLSLHVERGDIYGFLGPNGAGKSTTLRMLLGLIRPTAGKVEFPNHGLRWDYLQARSRIGAIIETPAFYENFSARRNLQLLASLSGGALSKRVDEVLDIVGLKERAHDPVKVFSYGMRQRLGIAQALLPAPQLIILDEPTNGLDPQGIQQTRQLIRRLRDELKLTVLLSSHLLVEVEQLCNRVGIINEGRLLYEGEPATLVAPTTRFKLKVDKTAVAFELLEKDPAISVSRNGTAYLHVDAQPDNISDVNALLVGHGIRVYELSPTQETLEEAFLRITVAKQ